MDQQENDRQPAKNARVNFGLGTAADFGPPEPGGSGPADGNASSRASSPCSWGRRTPKPIYELRQNVNRDVPTTWLDRDATGNYDPEEDAKKEKLRKAKLKEAKAKVRKLGKQQVNEQKGKVEKLIVGLRFPSGYGSVRNIIDDEENWPEHWSDVDPEDERERQARRALYRQRTPGLEPQVPIPDPKKNSGVDDLTGYPAARGCVQCRLHGISCSMVQNGGWPCEGCKQSKLDCKPITEPEIKGKCLRCEKDKAECSFEENGDQRGMCDRCIIDECDDCVAGPVEGHEPQRIDLDKLLYGPNRKYKDCTECRQEGKKCSIKRFSTKPPCKRCARDKIGCTFYDIEGEPKKHERKKRGATAAEEAVPLDGEAVKPKTSLFSAADLADLDDVDGVELEREETPELRMEDTTGNHGVVTTIWTSYAHPIAFNAKTRDRNLDCNWCQMPTFSLLGYFEVKAHALRWDNGLGFTELQGGHRETNDENVMCQDCTTTRLQIMLCNGHDVVHIPGGDPDGFEECANQLLNAESGSDGLKWQLQRWCSICFSVATHKCCTAQTSVEEANENESEMVFGCGLRFCDRCERRYREEFEGVLEDMVAAVDKEPKMRSLDSGDDSGTSEKPRADVGFLSTGGLLMANILREAEAMGLEEDDSGGYY
ncbi:hypothetical protein BCR34DRAFT_561737 [Clohesyomyces aquaticus]|uniref:Zn(2)-C6 fungal-type domain-containing protein n=1 Tax=Clohesyomyces aquaticus TaxID=1231657 RepID=A0A1Y1ZTJ3_9PLEO|nr:hypothetical protein BCR34DRAFT_561737 [Clohesyomyces aquaticus]